MTSAERQREKRERDRETVWGTKGGQSELSDGGLLERIAVSFRKERATRKTRNRGVIRVGLVQELLRRLEVAKKTGEKS